jgi:GNAT superfamily N-acetyltransferase
VPISAPGFLVRNASEADMPGVEALVRADSIHSPGGRRRRAGEKDVAGSHARTLARGRWSRFFSRIYAFGMTPDGVVVALSDEGRVIGCCRIKQHRKGIREFAMLVVAREWRGKGVAMAMGKHVIANTPGPLWGTCLDRHTALYRRAGAVEVVDSRRIPLFMRRRQRLFGLIFRLVGKKARLVTMVFEQTAGASSPLRRTE